MSDNVVPLPTKPDPQAAIEKEYEAARRMAIEMFLAEEATQERVATAVQGALAAITEQNNKGKTVRIGQAAAIITAVVLESLQPTPEGTPPSGGQIMRTGTEGKGLLVPEGGAAASRGKWILPNTTLPLTRR